jgi:nickel-dependent lactate racemase
MQIIFAFGRTGLNLDLPQGFDYQLLEARSAVPLDDPATAITRALDAPAGCPPLAELARGKRSAAISVCDITRPAPNQQVLPPLLKRHLTFYQAVKGITAASHIVKPGGAILLLAACEEGVGGPEFARMLAAADADRAFLKKIEGVPVTIDQWQLEKLALVTTRMQVLYYVPGLPPEYHRGLWGKSCASPAEAVSVLAAALPRNAKVALIPEGPYVLARANALQVTPH